MINLNGIKMNVIETAPNGIVNKDTIFIFTQIEDRVYAEYAGGKIEKGFLVGKIIDHQLKFSYCQLQIDGNIDNGMSSCELSINEKGKIILTEHFEWGSGKDRIGTNIFREI
jgi:hypothetical protein